MGRNSRTATVEAPSSRHEAPDGDVPRREARQLVRAAARHGNDTRLALSNGRALLIDAAPDTASADRVRARFRRVHRAELVLGDGEIVGYVHGTGHRRDGAVPVSVGVVLALALDGCPTIVSVDGWSVR